MAEAVTLQAARLLRFNASQNLAAALSSLRDGIVRLAGAGVLGEVGINFKDETGEVKVRATFDAYDLEERDKIDLSALRLVPMPNAVGTLRILCFDLGFAESVVGAGWLKPGWEPLRVAMAAAEAPTGDGGDLPKPVEEDSKQEGKGE
ncbi:MAG: hypothetical protein HYX90_03525 [Chloroflexi bacterium]|nr:hypothetical protein [Chloroflexota bacterium]